MSRATRPPRLRTSLSLLTMLIAGVTVDASAEELSRADKLRVLYSNQFAFDRRGVPLITIRIAEGKKAAAIQSEAPVRVFPDGEDGAEVLGGKRWDVRLVSSTPATVKHQVILAREPISRLGQLRSTMATWQARGARCRLIEIGTIFGVKGKIFDNRAYVLVDGPYQTRDAARRIAEKYHSRYGLEKVATLPQLVHRPTADLEAVDKTTGARIRARDAIWFGPASGKQLQVSSAGSEARRYWGQVYVTVDRSGKLAVVNAVPADRLLAGLVPSEIFPSAPRAALQAQSVAARGELLAKIGTRHLVDPYLICATQHCQVYKGAGQEHPRTTRAVKATRGVVLVRPDGRLMDAVYSANAGGFTEHNDYAWPVEADPHLRGHLDAAPRTPGLKQFRGGITEDNIEAWLTTRPATWSSQTRYNRDKYRWTQTITARGMTRMVRDLKVGRVRALKVLERGVSGRATLIEIKGTRGDRRVRGELTIRRQLGDLRSSMFIVRTTDSDGDGLPDHFVLRGGGWGHGVGMCQTGAIGMAEAGKSYKQILLHYYQGAQLSPLY